MASYSKVSREVVRSLQFLSVSLVSALSNVLYIAVCMRATTLPFWSVSLSSTEFSMVINFILNDRITFRALASNRSWGMRLARFQFAALGGNLLTAALSTFLHDGASLSPVYSQAGAIMFTFVVNFFVHRFWTFNRNSTVLETSSATQQFNTIADSRNTWMSGMSVIIPVRNERETIPALLERLHSAMVAVALPYEVLIVDDYSSDDTAHVADKVIEERQLPARVLSKRGQIGKSFSLMEGFAEARYSVLAMIDGDLELPPEVLPEMARQLVHYDVVVGRRIAYSRNNTIRGQMSSAFNNLLLKYFLGITCEVQTGVKVFWKHVYESEQLTPGPWGFDMEFVAKSQAKGFSIGEYEVPFQKRQTGQSKVNIVLVATELIALAIRIKLAIGPITKATPAGKSVVNGNGYEEENSLRSGAMPEDTKPTKVGWIAVRSTRAQALWVEWPESATTGNRADARE